MLKHEKIWLTVSSVMIIGFMIATGIQTFAFGMGGPPSETERVDPQKVDEHEVFSEPGVYEVGENKYEVVMTLEIFSFNPGYRNSSGFRSDSLK